MKKTIFFAIMATAMLVSCGGAEKKEKKADAAQSEQSAEKSASADNEEPTLETPTNAPVASGDIVYLDFAYLSVNSKFYKNEGVAFETKLADFQSKAQKTQQSWQNKEQALATEAQKVQDDYNKSMITSITAQQKMEDIERRAAEYQQKMQREGENLAKEEGNIYEEQRVLDTRFMKLVELAVDNINVDGRYKMIVRKDVVVDANEQLNITALVLAEMDKLYEEGALD